MNAKLLIVDDEKDMLELLTMSLEAEGYVVCTAINGQEASAMLAVEKPDLILMDVMLGDMSGVNLTAKIKNNPDTQDIPVIMLSAKDSETDVIVGLRVGADDYVTKPFSTQILLARIEAVLKRISRADVVSDKTLIAGPIKVLMASQQALAAGKDIELTTAELSILVALMRAGGSLVTRTELKTILGSESAGQQDRIVDVHVAAIRKKLGEYKTIIKTVHKQGYRLNI